MISILDFMSHRYSRLEIWKHKWLRRKWKRKETKVKSVSNYTKDKSIKEISYAWSDKIKLNDETDLFTEIELKNKMKEKIEECFNLMELNKK